LRHIAVPTTSGYLITFDVQIAREQIATVDFFGTVFQEQKQEQNELQTVLST
jgi:hypothetical protein